MLKKLRGILLMVLISATAWSQGPSLDFVIPDQSDFATTLPKYRYGGKTEPANRLTLNGTELRIYPSGAFAGILSLETGKNTFEFNVINSFGEKTSRIFTIERKAPLESCPADKLLLEKELLLPDRDYSLVPGDTLNLKVKGTPGAKVTAHIKGYSHEIPMVELPPEQAGGLKGIYSGVAAFYPGDYISASPVEYQLVKDSLGETILSTQGSITLDVKMWPRVGLLNEEGGYLIAGTGEARLGGAQLGFLPGGTCVVLDGKIGSLYRVRLEKDMHALISGNSIQLQPQGVPFPSVVIGAGTVQKKDKWDEVILSTDRKIPVLFEADKTQPRLKIHLYGATSNLTWITHKLPLRMIKDIDWQQAADGHLIINLELKTPPVWGYDAFYEEGSQAIHLRVKTKPILSDNPMSPLKGLMIALDSGHGGNNSGALGSTGLKEKDCNFAIVNYLAKDLRKRGAQVVLVKPEDVNLAMDIRRETVLDSGADILLSVHNNSIGESSDPITTKGSMTLYRHAINRDLAESIHNRLRKVTGLTDSGLISSFNFYLVKHTEIPSVLMETAFMSNPEDEMLVGNPKGQKEIAEAIARGVTDYINRN